MYLQSSYRSSRTQMFYLRPATLLKKRPRHVLVRELFSEGSLKIYIKQKSDSVVWWAYFETWLISKPMKDCQKVAVLGVLPETNISWSKYHERKNSIRVKLSLNYDGTREKVKFISLFNSDSLSLLLELYICDLYYNNLSNFFRNQSYSYFLDNNFWWIGKTNLSSVVSLFAFL